MPDRPGALGQVASRVGAVGGDVVGIDILERGAGRAIDELVVELPGRRPGRPAASPRCSRSTASTSSRSRPAADSLRDPRLDALETAAILVGRLDPVERARRAVRRTRSARSAPPGRWSSSSRAPRSWPQRGRRPGGAVARGLRAGQPVVGQGRRRRRRSRRRDLGAAARHGHGARARPRRHAVPCPGAAPGGSAGADRRHSISRADRASRPAALHPSCALSRRRPAVAVRGPVPGPLDGAAPPGVGLVGRRPARRPARPRVSSTQLAAMSSVEPQTPSASPAR